MGWTGEGTGTQIHDQLKVRDLTLSTGRIGTAPVNNDDIANKFYVDSNDFWTKLGDVLSPDPPGCKLADLGTITPDIDQDKSLGTNLLRWRDLHLSHDATITGDVTANGLAIGNATPTVTGSRYFHLKSTSSEPIKIEKSNSAGVLFSIANTTNTWAIGENSSEDFIFRDITGGDNDIMRIQAGAPASTLLIDSSGNVGIGRPSIFTLGAKLHVDGEIIAATDKIKLTALGGYAIKLTNKTGSNSVAGQLVQTDTTQNDAVTLSGVNSDDTIGIILDSGVSDGTSMWVVVYGIANVMMDAVGSVRGDRIITAPVGGFATPWNVGGAVATHFQEIGHCIETRIGAGLARCVLHFN
ncbi:hypothetical protein LCGC14_0774140 [marine sediment metagenome]|uniref:Uncharacterized protein n=1 Tax=marine sediment metagenome TaxID=412755 RepID=A0A0F9SHD9_9ZZZZ